ncbi:MAG: metal-sensitive transcriptional regulator [Flavobacterium sp.]|nr:metal-sensitive transcriptional regulator [Flavobacterium sp.]
MQKEPLKLPSDLISDIKTRLKTLSGQINGVVKMLDEGKDNRFKSNTYTSYCCRF